MSDGEGSRWERGGVGGSANAEGEAGEGSAGSGEAPDGSGLLRASDELVPDEIEENGMGEVVKVSEGGGLGAL